MNDLSNIFKLSSLDAIKYFDDKLPKDYDYDKLRFSAYNRTFLISGINEIETLKRIHSILKKGLSKRHKLIIFYPKSLKVSLIFINKTHLIYQ